MYISDFAIFWRHHCFFVAGVHLFGLASLFYWGRGVRNDDRRRRRPAAAAAAMTIVVDAWEYAVIETLRQQTVADKRDMIRAFIDAGRRRAGLFAAAADAPTFRPASKA